MNKYYTIIPGVMFTSDELSRLWNEMVIDGELCGNKCDFKFEMTEVTFSAWPPTDLDSTTASCDDTNLSSDNNTTTTAHNTGPLPPGSDTMTKSSQVISYNTFYVFTVQCY